MRNAFIKQLMQLAQEDKRIVLITGDMGYSVFEPFIKQFPDRFINAGIAEQNMTGLAAGLALSGKIVFTYSIVNFATLRCLEQIRNDICAHNANVKIVSVGSGFAYGTQGYTHHGVEDVSIMRCLPQMKIMSPADPAETIVILTNAIKHDGPCYIRLGKAGENTVHKNLSNYHYPDIIPVITGFDKTILATGSITSRVANYINQQKKSFNLYSIPVIKPIDIKTLTKIAESSKTLITLEEHQLNGGFGSAILETLNDLNAKKLIKSLPSVHRLGIEDSIFHNIDSQKFFKNIIEAKLKEFEDENDYRIDPLLQ